MSAADKTKLDALPGALLAFDYVQQVAAQALSTSTILEVADLTITGLKERGRGKAVAWTDDEMKALFDAATKLDVELLH